MKFTALLIPLILAACSHSSSPGGKTATAEASSKDRKIAVETEDVQVEKGTISLPIKVRCIEGYKTAVLQIGDMYKAFQCGTGLFSYIHKFPVDVLKENRKKRKDYVLRIRAFHEEQKDRTLGQLLVIISYKDFQSKLVIAQSLVTIDSMDGVFSDLAAHGQCMQGGQMEIEIYDDWRGVSLEEETIPCSETGFAYFSRRPGLMKKGMRLLIRQTKNEKPLSSYEVVLFN